MKRVLVSLMALLVMKWMLEVPLLMLEELTHLDDLGLCTHFLHHPSVCSSLALPYALCSSPGAPSRFPPDTAACTRGKGGPPSSPSGRTEGAPPWLLSSRALGSSRAPSPPPPLPPELPRTWKEGSSPAAEGAGAGGPAAARTAGTERAASAGSAGTSGTGTTCPGRRAGAEAPSAQKPLHLPPPLHSRALGTPAGWGSPADGRPARAEACPRAQAPHDPPAHHSPAALARRRTPGGRHELTYGSRATSQDTTRVLETPGLEQELLSLSGQRRR
ncbi:hypothetical protein FKM82_019716 [Ascaphus truei]